MYSGGANFTLTEDQVSALSDMLDPENAAAKMAFQRPETQAVGYSWSEAQPKPTTSSTSVENNVGKSYANPGSIYVPPSVGTNNPHLPVVSGSKAAKEAAAKNSTSTGSATAAAKPKNNSNSIWDDDEVEGTYGSKIGASTVTKPAAGLPGASGEATEKARDLFEVPKFSLMHRQLQTAEDTYLGADFTKDGSAAMAEELAVSVNLPKLENLKELELDVEAFALHVRTRVYKLRVDLPIKCVEKKAHAKWDGNTKVLSVTLTTHPDARKVKMMA